MGNRSLKKGPFVDGKLLQKFRTLASAETGEIGSVMIKTWSRRSTILPEFVGWVFSVYNGRKFIPVRVSPEMVGKRLGAFSPTRNFSGHGANRKASVK